MSRRTDVIRELRKVRAELDDAKREVDEVSGANGRLAAQVDDRDVVIRGLAGQNRTLLAVVQAMQVEDLEAGFTS